METCLLCLYCVGGVRTGVHACVLARHIFVFFLCHASTPSSSFKVRQDHDSSDSSSLFFSLTLALLFTSSLPSLAPALYVLLPFTLA